MTGHDRYLCLDCRREIAYRDQDYIAPTANGRIVAIAEGKMRIRCVRCGAERWILLPTSSATLATQTNVGG